MMMEPPVFFHAQPLFGIEVIYTVIITVFCFLVFFKTKEIFSLTKHEGIKYFRHSFLFFGLSYASRLLLHLFMIGNGILFDARINRGAFLPVSSLFVGYLSTIALLYLTYSTIWKKYKIKHFELYSNLLALAIAIIGFFSRNPSLISLIQIVLIAFIVIAGYSVNRTQKKFSNIRILYLLISIFWMLNLFLVSPERRLIPEIKFVFQGISIIMFILIYYRVNKWIR